MKRQDDFAVGLVVIVAVIAVTAMALWLSRSQIGARERTIVARMRDVGGGQVGSPVVSYSLDGADLAPRRSHT